MDRNFRWFILIRNALSPDVVAEIDAAVDEVYAKEEAAGRLELSTLSRILNTTIMFYGRFPIEGVYNIAIIAQFRCASREVKKSPFRFLILILKDRKNI